MAPDSPSRLPAALSLDTGDGRIEAVPFGAHLLSWRCRGRERLYLSPRARYGAGRAIRGGVPVIFPQFGAHGDGPRHGFARVLSWRVAEDGSAPGASALRFVLDDREETRTRWPHRFQAELAIAPDGDRLRLALSVRNTDAEPFAFTAALHTYLAVAELGAVVLDGLEDRPWLDATRAGQRGEPSQAPLRFQGETDRVYLGTNGRTLRLHDGESVLRLQAEGFADTVVWNPGAAQAAALDDLGAGEHRRFVCVEAAAVAEPVRLAPGQAWTGTQRLQVEAG